MMGPGNAEEDPAEGSQLLNEADGLTGGGVVGGVGTRGPTAVFDEPLFPAGMFMAIADGAGGAGGAINAAIVGELGIAVCTYKKTYKRTHTSITSQSAVSNADTKRENVEGHGIPEGRDGGADGRRETNDGVTDREKQIGVAGNLSEAGGRTEKRATRNRQQSTRHLESARARSA